jgi:hypothetical protein
MQKTITMEELEKQDEANNRDEPEGETVVTTSNLGRATDDEIYVGDFAKADEEEKSI